MAELLMLQQISPDHFYGAPMSPFSEVSTVSGPNYTKFKQYIGQSALMNLL